MNALVPEGKRLFALTQIWYRPDLVRSDKLHLQALIDHLDYHADLIEQGKSIIAGGFLDGTSGMDLCTVETLEEAVSIAKNDPLILANVAHQTVREYQVDIPERRAMIVKLLESLN